MERETRRSFWQRLSHLMAVPVARTLLVADELTFPLRQATATLMSYECALIDTVFERIAKRWPVTAPVTGLLQRLSGIDDVVISPSSHMGRPRRLRSLLLTLPLPALLSPLAVGAGKISYWWFHNHPTTFDPDGRVRRARFAAALQRQGNDRLRTEGSDAAPTEAVRMRYGMRRVAAPAAAVMRPPGVEKIKHIVVVMQENRTYDEYAGRLGVGDGDPNLFTGTDTGRYTFPWLPTHGIWSWHQRKWMTVHEQHDPGQIPWYAKMFREYALLDDVYCATRGPSTANHLMHIAADAHNLFGNPYKGWVKWFARFFDPQNELPPFDIESVPHRLERAGRTWGNYGSGMFTYIKDLADSPNNLQSEQFEADVRAGKIRDVSYVVAPNFGLNEHSPDSVYDGMQWVAEHVVRPIVDAGNWNDTAVLVTWDDFGGYADHVTPPLTEMWKHDPSLPYTLGARVPLLVMSPYAKSDYISRPDHGADDGRLRSFFSVPAFIESVFGLPALNQRDANADNLLGAFDFDQQPLPAPDTTVPPRPVNSSFLRRVSAAWHEAGNIAGLGDLVQMERSPAGLREQITRRLLTAERPAVMAGRAPASTPLSL